jgi:hypothetical protein
MSYFGKILSLPLLKFTRFATIRDEFGNNQPVDVDEIPEGSKEGDDFAYRVEFSNKTGQMVFKNDKK